MKWNLSRWLLFIVVVAFLGPVMIKAIQLYHPSSDFVARFNSDNAIATYLINDSVWDWFRLYFFGMDRHGVWPYLIPRLIHAQTGYVFDVIETYRIHAVGYLTISFVSAYFLSRFYGALVASLLIGVITLAPMAVYDIFQTCTPFAWQTGAMLGTWALARKIFAASGLSFSSHAQLPPGKISPGWYLGFFVTFYCAVWSSLVSAPLLYAVLLGEWGVRAYYQGKIRTSISPLKRLAGVSLAAIVLERGLNQLYHRYSQAQWNRSYTTDTTIDWGNFVGNAQGMLETYMKSSWWPFGLAGLVLLGPLLLAMIYLIGEKRRSRSLEHHEEVLSLFTLSLGCFAIAMGNFVITFLSAWVRLSQYNSRYLAPTMVFMPFGVLLILLALLFYVLKTRKSRLGLTAIGAFLIPLGIYQALPQPRDNDSYAETRRAAKTLAEKAPGAIVLGGYWGTYLLPAAYPEGDLVPLPHDRDVNRMPWLIDELKQRKTVILSHFPGGFVSFDDPPETLHQHGYLLRLEQKAWLSQGPFHFTLYKNLGPLEKKGEMVQDQHGASREGT